MPAAWTVRTVTAWTQSDLAKRGFDSPRLDADLMIAHALGVTRIQLFLDLDRPLDEGELGAVRALVERRRRHEPIAYILGEREFYGHRLDVSPEVLIPRPDTETLVERGLALFKGPLPLGPVLDLCTGSGAIALSIALGSDRELVACDLSPGALAVARRNAAKLGVADRVRWAEGDLFDAVAGLGPFACITANPPYVGESELSTLPETVRDYEPRLALDAGPDALSFYRRIAADAPRFLLPAGALLVEVGQGQAPRVRELFSAAGLCDLAVHRDLAGIERVVEARRSVD